MAELDDVLRQLGDFGRYQTLQFSLLCLYGCWFTAWQLMSIIFTASTPQIFYCTPPPGFSANETNPSRGKNGDGVAKLESCNMFAVHDGRVTENLTGCDFGWDYVTSQDGETTIVTDFNLICENGILGETVQSVFFGGVLAGALISGQLSDIIGRKIVIHASLVGEALAGLALALSRNFYLVVIFIFLVGLFQQGIHLTTFVMYMEMFTPEKRSVAGGISNLMWGFGVALITPIALLLPNWRHLQLTISLVCLISVPLYWFFHESVRWLISRGRIDEAEKIFHLVAKFNHIPAPRNFLSTSLKQNETESNDAYSETLLSTEERKPDCQPVTETKEEVDVLVDLQGNKTRKQRCHDSGYDCTKESKHQKTLLHLLRRPILFRNYIFMCYCWFVNSTVYYGLSLNSVNLAGNKYLNIFLLCVVEIPSGIFIIIALKWFPRRWCQSVSFLIAGILCIITASIPEKTDAGTDLSILIVTAATLGKFSISFSFCMVFIYTSEWLPTIVRNAGMGGTSLCARVGGMVAPFLVYLRGVSSSLPLIIFGTIAVIAGLLALFFPETLNQTMPTTIEDAERLAEESSLRCTRRRRSGVESQDRMHVSLDLGLSRQVKS